MEYMSVKEAAKSGAYQHESTFFAEVRIERVARLGIAWAITKDAKTKRRSYKKGNTLRSKCLLNANGFKMYLSSIKIRNFRCFGEDESHTF